MPSEKKISMPMKIRDKIFRDILNGVWNGDDLLPGASELARRYNAGFCSTNAAIKLLSEEGIILRRNGRRARIVKGGHRRWQIGIVVDDAFKSFPPFDYTHAATTFLKFNAVQLELSYGGYAALSMPPDLDFLSYLPKLDGVIVLRDTDGKWRFTESEDTPPAVYCFNQRPENAPVWSNYLDYEAAFSGAATTLVARGAKEIVLVSNSNRQHRFEMALAVVEKYPQIKCSIRLWDPPCERDESEKLAVELLDSVELPCGFIVVGDLLGWRLIQEALKRNLVLKKDVSIIGSAGLPESSRMNPALSVIEVPVKAQAAAAVRQMENMLGNNAIADGQKFIKIEAKLLLRDT
ncbi:MAG: GntR family transcriptional regulator [Lentisphaerae bacterium]|nr:GntR family transcriptional regulator [Lentisphaerota bacterium]